MTSDDRETYVVPPPETFKGKEFRPYVTALGQLALAWNELHECLGYLFTSIMPEDKYDRAHYVWYSSTQDRAQREMLKASLIRRPSEFDEEYPRAVEDIHWILGQVQSLEDARNTAIHSPLFRYTRKLSDPNDPRIIPLWIFGHTRATRLAKQPDILAEFRWCRDAALALRNFVILVDEALYTENASWPQRPSLPNRGQKKSHQGQRRQPPQE